MSFYTKLGIEYYNEIPLLKYNGKYEAYDKRKKSIRPCTLREYDQEIAEIYWEDTNRAGKIPIGSLVCKSVIPNNSNLLKMRLIIDSIECWKCQKRSDYVLGLEVVFDDRYLELNTNVDQTILRLFNQDVLKQYKFGEVKQRYSRTTQTSYISQGCYHCDALFGNYYLQEDLFEYRINSSWPEAVDEVEITYEKYFELTSDTLVFNDIFLLQNRLEYLKDVEYHLDNFEGYEEEENQNIFEEQTFTYGDLKFHIKKGSLGLELYCGNALVKPIESAEEGKIKAQRYAKTLKELNSTVS